ncbi:MAG TPA: hypothetical protein VNP36_04575 [Burkholderiales bacterium]|nr:hypothetical protein [Burkholderiales bacterium]
MDTNPYRAPAANVAERDAGPGIEATWGRATKVWWSLIWRAVLFGGLAGMLAGGVIGAILGAAGVPQQTIATVGGWLGILVSIPVGIWVVRSVLRKSWSDFRIVLIPVSK